MKKVKYLIEFLFIKFLFIIFKIIGYKNASSLGAKIGSFIGPIFRSRKITENNIKKCLVDISDEETNQLMKKMWENYGRIFSEYMYIEKFRNRKLEKYLNINGQSILENIKKNDKPVIFISGHFNNFELMAMQLE